MAKQSDQREEATTLQEFCIALSQRDNRVELIGAFHHTESAAGRAKDLASLYAERFQVFANSPVRG
jgi:hypothetical protein